MKKVSILAILAIALGSVLWISCSKIESDETSHSMDENISSEKMSYTIPANHLAKELNALIEGREKNNFTFDRASFKYLPVSDHYIINILDGDDLPTAIVCQGSGYSFASCVGNWLKENPDDCLIVSYDPESEDFFADDDC